MKSKEKIQILLWEIIFNFPAHFCYFMGLKIFFTENQALILALTLFFNTSLKDAQFEELKQRIKKLEENL
jgi:hypothetical protein